MMICKNCGFEFIDEYNKFCPNCGTAIYSNNEQGTSATGKKQFKINKPIIIVAIIVLIVVIAGGFILSNATATKELEAALSSKNADLVNSIYSEAFGNEKLLMKYDEVIAETIDEIKNDLNSHDFKDEAVEDGDMAVENYLINKWGSLLANENALDLSASISPKNQPAWEELWDLEESKAYYCDGVCFYFKYKEYESAIESFSSVIDSDSAYEDAKKMIEECVDSYINSTLQTVEEWIADGDFSGGLDLLKNAKDYLDECGLDSNEISNKIDETLAEYAASYAAKADEALKEHDVNAAIANIEVAIELQPDNGEYKTRYDTYQQYIPFELYMSDNCLNVARSGGMVGSVAFDLNDEANNNESMEHVLYWGSSVDNTTSSYVTTSYNLDGKYNVVKGTFYLAKHSKDTTSKGWFIVYGDGKKIYESEKMTGGVLPKEISFDITGIHDLKISFYGVGRSAGYGISNLIAQKNFPN